MASAGPIRPSLGMAQTEHRFTERVEVAVSATYLLYLPDDHQKRDDRPLIVFLHGSGGHARGQTCVNVSVNYSQLEG